MMDDVIRNVLLIMSMLLPSELLAAEPLILPREDSFQSPKRFIPLNGTRAQSADSQNGVTIINEKKFIPLRTDASAMSNGNLVVDRAGGNPVAAPIAKTVDVASRGAEKSSIVNDVKVTHELEPESDGIEGDTETINPVIALYGSESSGPLGSFRDVMRGGGAGSFAGLARHLMWPIPLAAKQYVSSGYGVRNDPFHGRPTFHGGIDIAADAGTAVLATAAGEVTQVTEDARYGKYVSIKHADDTITRYGHLSSQSVSVGQRVRAGQLIGAVGSSGRSTGAHLDYRVSKNGVKYDPLSILTIPSNITVKASNMGRMASATAGAPSAVNIYRGAVASNPTPKRPMVIQVR